MYQTGNGWPPFCLSSPGLYYFHVDKHTYGLWTNIAKCSGMATMHYALVMCPIILPCAGVICCVAQCTKMQLFVPLVSSPLSKCGLFRSRLWVLGSIIPRRTFSFRTVNSLSLCFIYFYHYPIFLALSPLPCLLFSVVLDEWLSRILVVLTFHITSPLELL